MDEQDQNYDEIDYENEARKLGHVPKEQFRGNPDLWVDAKTFYERGQTVMPILKKHNKELEQKVAAQEAQLRQMQELLQSSQESIEALKEFHSENTRRQVEQAKVALMAELRQAKEDGNVELEVQLTDQLQQTNLALKADDKKETKKAVASQHQEQVDPEFAAWHKRNPWYGTDARKTNLAMSITYSLRANPEFDDLQGVDFYNKVAEEVMAQDSKRSGTSKVEGARNGGQSSSGSGYESLSAEEKAYCNKEAKRFVGAGKMFKTESEWRSYFAKSVRGE